MIAVEINLVEQDLVGQGAGSLVYQHPAYSDKLIKIVRAERINVQSDWPLNRKTDRMLRPDFRRHGPFQEWYAELEEYITLVNRLQKIPDFVAGYHGFVQTNFGPGLVVERVALEDGTLGPTLKTYLRNNRSNVDIEKMVEDLLEKIFLNRLVLSDFSPNNVVLGYDHLQQKNRLVIVDGISEGTVIKIQRWSDFAFRQAWEKSKKSFLRKLPK